MKQNNRGQAALEFLLTYSWAILVVIVIIGALAYFGVLNPENFIPEKCTFSAGIACEDYVYDPGADATSSGDDSIVLRITNGLGRGIDIAGVTLESSDLETTACTPQVDDGTGTIVTIDSAVYNHTLSNGESADITLIDCGAEPGVSKLRAEVGLVYTFSGGLDVPKTIPGEVFVSTGN